MLSKAKRLKLILERLDAATPAGSETEALALLSQIMTMVEDEHSGIENNPNAWRTDGRMYPPQEDNRRAVPDRPSLSRYRSVRHNTFIGANGSLQIVDLQDGKVLLDKAGQDGRRVDELDVEPPESD